MTRATVSQPAGSPACRPAAGLLLLLVSAGAMAADAEMTASGAAVATGSDLLETEIVIEKLESADPPDRPVAAVRSRRATGGGRPGALHVAGPQSRREPRPRRPGHQAHAVRPALPAGLGDGAGMRHRVLGGRWQDFRRAVSRRRFHACTVDHASSSAAWGHGTAAFPRDLPLIQWRAHSRSCSGHRRAGAQPAGLCAARGAARHGRARGRSARRPRNADRRGRHGHRQDVRLPGARAGVRAPRHRLDRHARAAGPAVSPRPARDLGSARAARARGAAQGPRELPLPPSPRTRRAAGLRARPAARGGYGAAEGTSLGARDEARRHR